MLELIREQKDSLNKSERKVAEVILKDPEGAIRCSIAALAKQAAVSEPTVNRFCRSFDTSGFPDFKLALAQSIASGTLCQPECRLDRHRHGIHRQNFCRQRRCD